ncbi:MAG: tetratricopeptide repeat protein, partial [Candidatus Competibacteraceae bacterium]|nr:tetratricopeptide repeat protein [Candidatus Competibacteraceae bacterium]
SASLHQLAILEFKAGEFSKAKDLWQQSIAIKKTQSDISGQAASYIMLAQLEASQSNFDKALPLAREAVDLLERIGSGQAGQARQILQSIEAAAAGQDKPAPSAGFGAMMQALQNMPAEQALVQIDALLTQAREADEKAQLWLIRSMLCWNHDDREGCFQSIAEAEQCLASLPSEQREPLEQAIQAAKTQITHASTNAKAESVRLYEQAIAKFQAEQHQDALALFEHSLSASRTEQIPDNIAINLLMIGQILLLLKRPAEAMIHLQEGLTIATELDNEQLLQAMREIAAIAAQQSKA